MYETYRRIATSGWGTNFAYRNILNLIMNHQLPFTAIMRSLLLSTFLFPFAPSPFFTLHAGAQGIVFTGISPVQSTVAKWDKFEAAITLTANYTNPFNYSDIDVQAVFTSPTGVQHTVDAFWMQDYVDSLGNLSPVGTPGFRVRFTPDEIGQWSYVLKGYLNWNAAGTSNTNFFTCSGTSSISKGYIRKANSRYLKWDNGDQYIPVGENLAFPYGDVIQSYNGFLTKLKPTGVNYIRVWMATWGVALEWTNTDKVNGFNGLEQYKQTAAWQLDSLLNRGLTDGYALMLCINYHNQFLTDTSRGPEWDANPYNSIMGGPCAMPGDFFSNTEAKNIFKNRLRYMMARWGYAGTLESWELFNEVDNVDSFKNIKNDVDQWHDEMAAYMHSIDPNHLVTTSFGADTSGKGTWASPNIDFAQSHKYTTDVRLPRILANLDRQRVDSFGKPGFNGEFGLSISGDTEPVSDPTGITVHNCLWSTLLSGGMGSAAPWEWDRWIDVDNLYPQFSAPAAFKDVVPFVAGNDQPVKAAYLNTPPADLTVVPQQNWPDPKLQTPPAVLDFTVDNEGELTPDISNLNFFLWGMGAHQDYRRPPTFHITYLRDGSFIVNTASGPMGSEARISIYVDGSLVLDQPSQGSATYTVSITAGPHAIKVDNLGSDWTMVSQYQFLNAVGPLHMYTLQGTGGTQAAGYVLDRLYTFNYFSSNSGNPPPVVPAGAIVNMPNMQNGAYTLNFYTTAAAASKPSTQPIETRTATAVNGTLTFSLPAIPWDAAFTATSGTSPATLTTTVTAVPAAGWGMAPAANFVVSNSGITPDTGTLGMFLYGSLTNLQYRNPPTFVVNYTQTGFFQVTTAASISQGFPHVTVFLDGVNVFDQAASVSTTYTVNIPAGLHSIMVDNLGGDWVQVDHYTFVPTNTLSRALIPNDSAISAAFYPNPNRGLGYLDISSPHGDGHVTVYLQDMNGNIVYQALEQLSGTGKTILMLNLKTLASGIYTVNIRFNTGELISKKVVIVK